jgi:hypothetical protein
MTAQLIIPMADMHRHGYLIGNDSELKPLRLEKAKDLKNNQEFRAGLWQAHQDNKSDFCNLFENRN